MYFFYYYPIGVDVPRPRVPWVTYGFMAAFIAVFLLSMPLAYTNTIAWGRFVYRPAMLDPLTPFTAIMLHGGWLHLIGNLLYLWVFGPALERALGRVGMVLVFVGTGALGNLAHGAIVTNLDPSSAMGGVIGASGAISGLLGLFLLRFPYGRIRLAYWAFLPLQGINRAGVVALPAVIGVLLWILMQVVMVLVEGPAAGTAYGAHLGGLATGVLLAVALGMPWRASTENLLIRAQRHLARGNAHAAVGLLQRYLERVPWDREAQLELARSYRIAGDLASGSRLYRKVIDPLLAERRTAEACEVYLEARRADPFFHLDERAQRRVAFFLEKQGQFEHAVRAYGDFARFFADHPDAIWAITRSATLTMTRLRRQREGIECMQRALVDFPDHPLRDVLEQEVRKLTGARRSHVA